MPVTIPQSLFDKYYDVIDSTFDIFGVTCQLVSLNQATEVTYSPTNNIPEVNSINAHRRNNTNYDRGTKSIVETEVLTDIKLKVYWDTKQWIGATDSIQIPNGGIQTIGFMTDLPKVIQAKALIVHKDIKDYKELRFERVGEHIPLGLKQIRYFACFWKRI
jgi:hypothetical protein